MVGFPAWMLPRGFGVERPGPIGRIQLLTCTGSRAICAGPKQRPVAAFPYTVPKCSLLSPALCHRLTDTLRHADQARSRVSKTSWIWAEASGQREKTPEDSRELSPRVSDARHTTPWFASQRWPVAQAFMRQVLKESRHDVRRVVRYSDGARARRTHRTVLRLFPAMRQIPSTLQSEHPGVRGQDAPRHGTVGG
jgi:hypothetical protein